MAPVSVHTAWVGILWLQPDFRFLSERSKMVLRCMSFQCFRIQMSDWCPTHDTVKKKSNVEDHEVKNIAGAENEAVTAFFRKLSQSWWWPWYQTCVQCLSTDRHFGSVTSQQVLTFKYCFCVHVTVSLRTCFILIYDASPLPNRCKKRSNLAAFKLTSISDCLVW